MKVLNITGSRRYLALLLIILAMLFLASPASAGQKMPQFELSSPLDNSIINSRQYQGKVLLINFWATWCPPCRQEIPALIRLQNEFWPKGFSVIGISMDEGGTAIVKKLITKLEINYPVAMADSDVARNFGGIIGIPQSFLVDRAGNILKSYPGLIDHQEFENDIKTIIN